jgi:hypothetical protein
MQPVCTRRCFTMTNRIGVSQCNDVTPPSDSKDSYVRNLGFGIRDFTRTSVCHKRSGSTKITTPLNDMSHCRIASRTTWSNGWTSQVFITNTRQDHISAGSCFSTLGMGIGDPPVWLQTTKVPSWGYQRLVLGAIGSCLSIFGENRPRCLKHLSKLTFEYPHEGPCVGWGFGARGRPRAMRLNCNSSPQKCQSIALGATQFTTQMLCHQE